MGLLSQNREKESSQVNQRENHEIPAKYLLPLDFPEESAYTWPHLILRIPLPRVIGDGANRERCGVPFDRLGSLEDRCEAGGWLLNATP